MGVCERRTKQDVQTNQGEEHDRIIPAQVAVCNDSSNPWRDIEPEAVELGAVKDMDHAQKRDDEPCAQ